MRKLLGIGVLLGLMGMIPAQAGEGIPMGNAVFYPSVEVIYSHTDNLFLRDDSELGGDVSDSFWAIRPTVGFEFPFKESYVRINLSYQYKDYESYDLKTHGTYFADFDSQFKFGNDSILTVRNHFVRGVQEISQVDPGLEATWSDTKFRRDEFRVGYDLPINQYNTMGLFGVYNDVDLDDDMSARPFFGYRQYTFGAGWKYHFSALSSLTAEVENTRSKPREDFSDLFLATDLRKKYRENKFMMGWEGSINKRVSGYAKGGYKKMRFHENDAADFSGFVADAGLKFAFSEFLKADLNLFRNAYQSAFNVNNYYTATGGQAQLHQQVTRYFFWTAGYMHQANRYPSLVTPDIYGDGSYLDLPSFLTMGQRRKDTIDRAFGEVGFHFTPQFSLRVNYQYEDRDSSINYYDIYDLRHDPYSYTENRFAFQAQLGW